MNKFTIDLDSFDKSPALYEVADRFTKFKRDISEYFFFYNICSTALQFRYGCGNVCPSLLSGFGSE